jgi:hypothetical protein
MHIASRGRVTRWSKEQIDKLSTPELRALLVNAERLKEPEVAALCNELLDARPRGHPQVRRSKSASEAGKLVTRGRAFEKHGVSLRNRVWSHGGIRTDGAVVLLVRADEVQEIGGEHSYLLWAPNTGESHPWSDTPGGQERLGHCRIALERGAAKGLALHGKGVSADRVLEFRVEKRGEEYWATCTPTHRPTIVTHE